MGVDIQCCAGLGVSQPVGYRANIHSFGDHQGGVAVPQRVERDLWQIVPFQKFCKPVRYGVGIDGHSVPLGKEAVRVHPLVSRFQPLQGLTSPVALQKPAYGCPYRQLADA